MENLNLIFDRHLQSIPSPVTDKLLVEGVTSGLDESERQLVVVEDKNQRADIHDPLEREGIP